MTELKNALNQLAGALTKAGSPLMGFLQPGLGKQQVTDLVKGYDLRLPDAVYELYAWRNGIKKGVDGPKEISLFNLGIFFPLQDSIVTYEVRKKGWPGQMFPLFASGIGEVFLISCDEQDAHGRIYYDAPSDPEFEGVISIFDSLEALILSVTECYNEGAYYFTDESPYLQIDDGKEKEICTAHNPVSEYWKL